MEKVLARLPVTAMVSQRRPGPTSPPAKRQLYRSIIQAVSLQSLLSDRLTPQPFSETALLIPSLPITSFMIHLNITNTLTHLLQDLRRPLMVLILRLHQLRQIPQRLRRIQHIPHHARRLIHLCHKLIFSSLDPFALLLGITLLVLPTRRSSTFGRIKRQARVVDGRARFLRGFERGVERGHPAREEFALDGFVLFEARFADFFLRDGEFLEALGQGVGFGGALGGGCREGLGACEGGAGDGVVEGLGLGFGGGRGGEGGLGFGGVAGFGEEVDLGVVRLARFMSMRL